MRISIIAVGTRMPAWISEGVQECTRRMPSELKLLWREIPLSRRGKDISVQKVCEAEGKQILKSIPAGDKVIALDVEGRRLSTVKLAQQLESWQMSGDNYSIVIGGPDGLSIACLQRAAQRWSLSDLTLPHPLVRVLLAEQLYRAWTITVNHPYHRQ